MANTNSQRPSKRLDDPSNVIAFQAGTDWGSQMHLDLNEHLVAHPSATFFLRVKGNLPNHSAIRDDDILIVDRALAPHSDSTIVAVIDGALVITPYRRLARLEKGDRSGTELKGTAESAKSAVWGVVTHVVHKI